MRSHIVKLHQDTKLLLLVNLEENATDAEERVENHVRNEENLAKREESRAKREKVAAEDAVN